MQLLAQIPDPSNVIDNASRYSWEAGLLAFLIIAGVMGTGFLAWKIGWYCAYKILGNEEKGTRGILGNWLDGELKWRTALTERIELQQEQCGEHVNCIKALTDSVRAEASTAETSNKHLERLVVLHEAQGDIGKATKTITASHDDIQRGKQAFCQACTMFREVSAKEFPNSADRVAFHCDEIERIIGEA